MKYEESNHAHRWLDNLRGIEIGGSAHNSFGLNTLNVDYTKEITEYKQAEMELCGEMLPVDILAYAWNIPVEDKSYDFVIASHVIEHIWDPIEAIMEWGRIAKKYIYLVVPQRNALPSDTVQPLTTMDEFRERHFDQERKHMELGHVCRWTSETFRDMCKMCGFEVVDIVDPDDKVGNGFAVVIDVQRSLGLL